MDRLNRMLRFRAVVSGICSLAILVPAGAPAFAQSAPPPQMDPAPPAAPALSRQKLEQLAAPVALYPDSLLTNLLMASTYPLDIVQAARWRRANSRLKGVELEQALQRQTWEDSVKAMTAFPDVLRMMDEKLEWTGEIGEAFLAQEDDLMRAVQNLRRKAEKAGNLKSSKQQRVRYVEEYVVIEPVDTTVVYVPYYEPRVYGRWEYVEYPPYVWDPPRRRPVSDGALWFGGAVIVGAALWASWDWNRRRVAVDPGRLNRFNRRPVQAAAPVTTWQHDPTRRRGAPYRAPVLIQKFTPGQTVPNRPGPRTPQPVVLPGAKGPAPVTVPPGAKGPVPVTVPPGAKGPVPVTVPLNKGPTIVKPTAPPKVVEPKGPVPTPRRPVATPVVTPRGPGVRPAPIAKPKLPVARPSPSTPRPTVAPPKPRVAPPRPVAGPPRRPAGPVAPAKAAPAPVKQPAKNQAPAKK